MSKDTEHGTEEDREVFEDINFDVDFEEDQDDFIDDWQKEFLRDTPASEDQEEEEEEEDEGADGGKGANGNELNFEEEEEEDEALKLDVEAFNKKLNTNFKTEQELIDFMKSKDDEGAKGPTDDEIINDADLAIKYYSPLVLLNDKDLMRKQFETLAINEKKDINDEDVQYEIEQKLQDLIDSYDLSNKASQLRDRLKGMITDAEGKKAEVIKKQEDLVIAQEAKQKEELQKAFIDINANKKFFGVDVEPSRLTGIYKEVSTGKFLEKIKSDPKLLVELATMAEYRDEISKKAGGRSYGDGVRDILDEFKVKKEDRSINRAQQRGSDGSSNNSKDLIKGFLS